MHFNWIVQLTLFYTVCSVLCAVYSHQNISSGDPNVYRWAPRKMWKTMCGKSANLVNKPNEKETILCSIFILCMIATATAMNSTTFTSISVIQRQCIFVTPNTYLRSIWQLTAHELLSWRTFSKWFLIQCLDDNNLLRKLMKPEIQWAHRLFNWNDIF